MSYSNSKQRKTVMISGTKPLGAHLGNLRPDEPGREPQTRSWDPIGARSLAESCNNGGDQKTSGREQMDV